MISTPDYLLAGFPEDKINCKDLIREIGEDVQKVWDELFLKEIWEETKNLPKVLKTGESFSFDIEDYTLIQYLKKVGKNVDLCTLVKEADMSELYCDLANVILSVHYNSDSTHKNILLIDMRYETGHEVSGIPIERDLDLEEIQVKNMLKDQGKNTVGQG